MGKERMGALSATNKIAIIVTILPIRIDPCPPMRVGCVAVGSKFIQTEWAVIGLPATLARCQWL